MNPVPKFVRLWAILTVAVTLLLLFVLGGFVTSFRVGMADRVWPTEPWYLMGQDWTKLEFGFLVEHTHRAAGWIVGIMVSLLAILAWWGEPSKTLRNAGLLFILGLLVSYGEFHRGMMKAWTEREANVPLSELPWPIPAGLVTLTFAGLCCGAVAVSLRSNSFGKWARSLAFITLIGVMIQGLLGGFRVLLDQLAGTQLAAYHGIFAQVVLGLMIACLTLMAPRREGDALPEITRQRLLYWVIALPALIYLQLVWAAWVRHLGSPFAQRLHILTAFGITGVMVTISVVVLIQTEARKRLAFAAIHLLAILVVQLALGVEAYLAKFATVGPEFFKLPMDRTVTVMDASIRTGHAVIGAALLASSIVLLVKAARKPVTA